MLTNEAVARNFRLMIVQVRKQLELTGALLDRPSPDLIKRIRDSDDYIDVQKSMIENECFKILSRERIEEGRKVDMLRALNIITSNLERIADFSANIARQTQHLEDHTRLQRFNYRFYFDRMLEGLDSVGKALFDRDASLALRIGYIEDELDHLYQRQLNDILVALRNTSEIGDLITTLFVLHYLERMGDALKNIGEAIILAALGERLKIHQYRVLDEALEAAPELRESIQDVGLASIWGTRSGARIGTMEHGASADRRERVIFKEGRPDKLQKERESLKRWSEVAPGLAPQVVEYQEKERGAALLLQYLDGVTLQDVILNGDAEVIDRALDLLEQTQRRIWTDTLQPGPVQVNYMQQLHDRLDDVYRLHPTLDGRSVQVGGLLTRPFGELIEHARSLDVTLRAPFSVFIHGDFNIDNIIYNQREDRLHYVDTHRSRDFDYVQDISVFLVSNFRLPIFSPRKRVLLEAVTLRCLQFARDFAAAHQDETFEARLALGLTRSFVTSTRFELNRRFARNMHQRAVYLLRRLLNNPGTWSEFVVPSGILLY